MPFPDDFHFLDTGRMERKNAFDAFIECYAAYREARLGAFAALSGNDDALENLSSFLFPFDDSKVDADRVADVELGDFARRLQLFRFEILQQIH